MALAFKCKGSEYLNDVRIQRLEGFSAISGLCGPIETFLFVNGGPRLVPFDEIEGLRGPYKVHIFAKVAPEHAAKVLKLCQ